MRFSSVLLVLILGCPPMHSFQGQQNLQQNLIFKKCFSFCLRSAVGANEWNRSWSTERAPIQGQTRTPLFPAISMEDLAREWAAVNNGKKSESLNVVAPPIAVQPSPVVSQGVKKQSQSLASSAAQISSGSSGPSLEALAREWAAMNKEKNGDISMPPLTSTAAKKIYTPPSLPRHWAALKGTGPTIVGTADAPKRQAVATHGGLSRPKQWTSLLEYDQAIREVTQKGHTAISSSPSGTSMEELARQWAAMNKAKDEGNPTPPTSLSYDSPKPEPHLQAEQQARPQAARYENSMDQLAEQQARPQAARYEKSIDQLAKEWAAMNADNNVETSTPAFSTAMSTTPRTPTAMDKVVQEWRSGNQDASFNKRKPSLPKQWAAMQQEVEEQVDRGKRRQRNLPLKFFERGIPMPRTWAALKDYANADAATLREISKADNVAGRQSHAASVDVTQFDAETVSESEDLRTSKPPVVTGHYQRFRHSQASNDRFARVLMVNDGAVMAGMPRWEMMNVIMTRAMSNPGDTGQHYDSGSSRRLRGASEAPIAKDAYKVQLMTPDRPEPLIGIFQDVKSPMSMNATEKRKR